VHPAWTAIHDGNGIATQRSRPPAPAPPRGSRGRSPSRSSTPRAAGTRRQLPHPGAAGS